MKTKYNASIIQKNRHKITYVNSGVANIYKDGTIEMHKDLNKPEFALLKEKILNHEMDHDFKKGFWYNMQVDLLHTIGPSGLFGFMAKRPSTWIQLLPFYFNKKHGLIYDKNLVVFWGIIVFSIIALIIVT